VYDFIIILYHHFNILFHIGKGVQPYTRRHPVICYTNKTNPEDLRAYMHADMDGCVSFPVNKLSLLNTVRAAIPQHLASLTTSKGEISEEESLASISSQKNQSKVYRLGGMGQMEGSTDSSSMAAKTLPIAQKVEDDIAFNGIVQIDADTRVPFMVMDASRTAKVMINTSKPFFNLVIVHDIFDTAERMKIFLRPMVQRYLGKHHYPSQHRHYHHHDHDQIDHQIVFIQIYPTSSIMILKYIIVYGEYYHHTYYLY